MEKTEAETEAVAPLDAYATAKPDEPTFTLQGGDPLAAPLVRLWALFAREAAGVPDPDLRDLINSTKIERVSTERERQELLKRATLAEEVSWNMDAYLKGQLGASEEGEISGEKLSVDDRLDLFDVRVRAAVEIANMIAVSKELHETLKAKNFEDNLAYAYLKSIFSMLQRTFNLVEPRRKMHISNV